MATISKGYIGTIAVKGDSTQNVISTIRKTLRGSGVRLRVRGRNPDRQQFDHLKPHRRGQRHGLRQDLPLKWATSLALYLDADYKKFGMSRYESVCSNWKKTIVDMFLTGKLIGNTNGAKLMVATVKDTDVLLPCLFCML